MYKTCSEIFRTSAQYNPNHSNTDLRCFQTTLTTLFSWDLWFCSAIIWSSTIAVLLYISEDGDVRQQKTDMRWLRDWRQRCNRRSASGHHRTTLWTLITSRLKLDWQAWSCHLRPTVHQLRDSAAMPMTANPLLAQVDDADVCWFFFVVYRDLSFGLAIGKLKTFYSSKSLLKFSIMILMMSAKWKWTNVQ